MVGEDEDEGKEVNAIRARLKYKTFVGWDANVKQKEFYEKKLVSGNNDAPSCIK